MKGGVAGVSMVAMVVQGGGFWEVVVVGAEPEMGEGICVGLGRETSECLR